MGKKRGRSGLCRLWSKQGECRFGDKCKFEHLTESGGAPDRNRQKNGDAVKAPAEAFSQTQATSTIPLYKKDKAGLNKFKCGVIQPRSLIERSFTRKYSLCTRSANLGAGGAPTNRLTQGEAVDENGIGSQTPAHEDLEVLQHFNGLRVLSLAQSHPTLSDENGEPRPKGFVKSIRFVESLNKLEVSGKAKSGAVPLSYKQIFCEVECSDGKLYSIGACVEGKVIEVNKRLVKKPELLGTPEGFLVVLSIASTSAHHTQFASLATREEYLASIIQST